MENKQKFHVYYSNKRGYYAGTKVAELDLDDTSAYGPETVTITLKADYVEKGEFRYSVHNFSAGNSATSDSLSASDAIVHVYIGNNLSRTFYVPQNKLGTVWHVFNINENGISAVNNFYSSNAGEVR